MKDFCARLPKLQMQTFCYADLVVNIASAQLQIAISKKIQSIVAGNCVCCSLLRLVCPSCENSTEVSHLCTERNDKTGTILQEPREVSHW